MHKLSCSVACGILVPRQGIEPMSPVVSGRFLISDLLGKSLEKCFFHGHILQESTYSSV